MQTIRHKLLFLTVVILSATAAGVYWTLDIKQTRLITEHRLAVLTDEFYRTSRDLQKGLATSNYPFVMQTLAQFRNVSAEVVTLTVFEPSQPLDASLSPKDTIVWKVQVTSGSVARNVNIPASELPVAMDTIAARLRNGLMNLYGFVDIGSASRPKPVLIHLSSTMNVLDLFRSTLRRSVLLTLVVSAVLATLGIWFGSAGVHARINRVIEVLQEYSRGRFVSRAPADGQDEIHRIARAANFLGRQASSIAELQTIRRSADRVTEDLETASRIQTDFVRICGQNLNGAENGAIKRLDVFCEMKQSVGGDFYFIKSLARGFLAVIGDVEGKGSPASILSAASMGFLRAEASACISPRDLMESYVRFMAVSSPRFAALTAVFREEPTGPFYLLTLGGISAYLIRADGEVMEIATPENGVSLYRKPPPDRGFLRWVEVPQDGIRAVVLMTDGVTDAYKLKFGAMAPQKLREDATTGFSSLSSTLMEMKAIDELVDDTSLAVLTLIE